MMRFTVIIDDFVPNARPKVARVCHILNNPTDHDLFTFPHSLTCKTLLTSLGSKLQRCSKSADEDEECSRDEV
jgi:hypothetical protein